METDERDRSVWLKHGASQLMPTRSPKWRIEGKTSRRTSRITVVRPAVQRVNVDFTAAMLKELDHEAAALNISRHAVVKDM